MKRDWVEIFLKIALLLTTAAYCIGNVWLLLGQPSVSHLLRVSFAAS